MQADSSSFAMFKQLACQGYQSMRSSATLLLNHLCILLQQDFVRDHYCVIECILHVHNALSDLPELTQLIAHHKHNLIDNCMYAHTATYRQAYGSEHTVLNFVQQRLQLQLSVQAADAHFRQLIDSSVNALAPRVLEAMHTIAVSTRLCMQRGHDSNATAINLQLCIELVPADSFANRAPVCCYYVALH
eukprot:7187-Heterococcus_DN1.PRE.3